MKSSATLSLSRSSDPGFVSIVVAQILEVEHAEARGVLHASAGGQVILWLKMVGAN